MKYSNWSTSNGSIQGIFTSTFHIRKQHPGRNRELPVSPIKALAQVLPCMCQVSYYKNKTLGSVQEHTSSIIAHDTSDLKRKRYAFVTSSLKLMPCLHFACSVCMPSRYTCIFCLLLTLYLLFHSYHQDTMGRGDKSKKYGSRDVEGSTSGSRNGKDGSTPPPPPSKSGNHSKGVEYTRWSPSLPSAPPLVVKLHSSVPRTTRSYPNRNSKNSDETSISLDTDAPPLGNLEVKRIIKKQSSIECILFLLLRISYMHAGKT